MEGPFKIVITDFGLPGEALEEAELRAAGLSYELVRLSWKPGDDLAPYVHDAHALMVGWAQIRRPLFASLKHCRVISRYGIGVDMIDLEAATEYGIPVCNVPDYCIDEVSTHTLAFVLALNRRLVQHHHHVAGGQWAGAPGGLPARLSSQTLGVLGLGKIGRAVARKAAGLGLAVIAHDPYLTETQAQAAGAEPVSLDGLLSRADYVCVHCPLTAETRHLIGAAHLAQMKPTAYLVNMARGPIVDQAALHQALSAGVIAGAALDVLEQEPPAPDEPLLALPNVLFSPHSSSLSAQSLEQLRRDTARSVAQVLKGETPPSVVNPGVLRQP
jgi:D-3-phosphoglycerate dehydrogenase